MEPLKDIVVIYHKNCHDGFGAAWAAWKKFGNNASYVAASYGDDIPTGIEGKEVYVLDFSFTAEKLPDLEAKSKNLVVIDHHKGAQAHVEAVHNHVFTTERSGAYLTWEYFHPGTQVPTFLAYIDEGDRYDIHLPDFDALGIYIFTRPRTFEEFDRLCDEIEEERTKEKAKEKGALLRDYRDIIFEPALNGVHFINLKGTIVAAVNVAFPMDEKSDLLHRIYAKYPPVSLSYRYDEGEWKCSLRSDGTFDCTALAKQFGGSGHPGASGFSIKAEPGVFPFEIVDNPHEA